MFLRTTISLCDSSNPVARTESGSSNNPENSSAYISATRSGVRASPSRAGSSPMASMISRTASTMRRWSIPAVGALIWSSVLPGRGRYCNRRWEARSPHRRAMLRRRRLSLSLGLFLGRRKADALAGLRIERVKAINVHRHLDRQSRPGISAGINPSQELLSIAREVKDLFIAQGLRDFNFGLKLE